MNSRLQPHILVVAEIRADKLNFTTVALAYYATWDEENETLVYYTEPLPDSDSSGVPDNGKRVFNDVRYVRIENAVGAWLVEWRKE